MSSLIGQTSLGSNDASILLTNVPCEATASVGHWVRMDSLGVAIRALADDTTNSNVIGIIEAKIGSTTCNIRVVGVTEGILSGLDVTKEYYLSETNPGEMAISPPTGAGSIVLKLGQPFSMTRFMVNRGNRIRRS